MVTGMMRIGALHRCLLQKPLTTRSCWTATRSLSFVASRCCLSDSSSLKRSEGRLFSSNEKIIPGIGKGKTSTGLVGLAVEHDWYNIMLEKFQALLTKMEESDMPETAQYRIDVTKWCNYVLKQAKENPEDPEAVEDAVQMGQVEELLEMADDEMVALDCYLETRMWELVEQSHAKVDFNPNPMRDPMAEDGDPIEQEALRKGNTPPAPKA